MLVCGLCADAVDATHLSGGRLFTTPRLQIALVIFVSGKTTVLDQLNALCYAPIRVANLSSSALIPRMLSVGTRIILLDEVDRRSTLISAPP